MSLLNCRSVAHEWRTPSDQLKQDDSKAVDIRGGGYLARIQALLGRHVVNRPKALLCAGELRLERSFRNQLGGKARQSKVEHPQLTIPQMKDVFGLQVAVDEPRLVQPPNRLAKGFKRIERAL
jgi:hypothetical protein